MKKLFFLILVLFVGSVFAQVRFDTVNTKLVGVGIVHTEILETTNPWTIDVLEIDLTNNYNKIESVKSRNKLIGNQTVSQMSLERDFPGHTVVGAINGDFYASGGIPIGKQVVNGEIVKQNSYYSSFGISKNNKLSLGLSNFNGTLITKSLSVNINDINNTRFENNLTLYNSFCGENTGTNQFGTEVLIKPINEWIVNDTVICFVENIENNQGSMALSENNAVLSGHGTSAQFLSNNVAVGDTIQIVLEFTSMLPQIDQVIGGYPKIINNGSNYAVQGYNEEGGPPHTFERHPRTAIGFSQDSTKLYFVTVDGRGYSIGMTLSELADFMISIGVYQGINLDGGGSTTMWVRNKIVNVPSDGSERPVGNGMLVYSTAPKLDSIAAVAISPMNLRIFKGENTRITLSAFDKFYNPIDIDESEIIYNVSEGIGIIDSTGLFTASNIPSTGFITAEYNGLTDSCFVYIKSIGEIILKPKNILTNTINFVEFKQIAKDVDGVIKNLENSEFNWRVTDTNIATINNNGILKGKLEGETTVIVQYEEVSDSAQVTVNITEGKFVLHSLDNIDDFKLAGDNINLTNSQIIPVEEPRTEGNSSLKVVYEYTGNSSKTYGVHLETNIEIEGVPDSIEVDLMTNGRRNQLIYFLSDDNGEFYQINVKKWADVSNKLDNQPGSFSNVSTTQPGSIFNFPVTLTGLYVKLDAPRDNGVVYKDSLVLDNLRISYPDITTDLKDYNKLPNFIELYQNYPNPFNPSTTISYTIPTFTASSLLVKGRTDVGFVSLVVYDILGREVATLVNEQQTPGFYEVEFNGNNLSSGMYFYKLQIGTSRSSNAGNFVGVKKMMLLK